MNRANIETMLELACEIVVNRKASEKSSFPEAVLASMASIAFLDESI